MDLSTLKENDAEIEQLLEAGKDPSGRYQILKKDSIVWVLDLQGKQHWVVLVEVCGDLIQYIHEQGQCGKGLTLD